MSMSVFKIFAYMGVADTFFTGGTQGIYNDAKIRSISDEVLRTDQVLKSLGKLAEGNPDQLPDRVCTERILRITPLVNCGNLGCEKRAECAAKVSQLAHIAGVAVGLASGAALSAYLFNSCLSAPGATMNFCAEDFRANLVVGKLGFALGAAVLCGYYLTRTLVYTRLIGLSGDLLPSGRINLLKMEYETLGNGLKEILGRTIDPQEIETLHRLAQKLLGQMPAIQRAICQSASLEKEEAMLVVIPMENACRQVLAYKGGPPA